MMENSSPRRRTFGVRMCHLVLKRTVQRRARQSTFQRCDGRADVGRRTEYFGAMHRSWLWALLVARSSRPRWPPNRSRSGAAGAAAHRAELVLPPAQLRLRGHHLGGRHPRSRGDRGDPARRRRNRRSTSAGFSDNGMGPSISTLNQRRVVPGRITTVYNPFFSIDPKLPLATHPLRLPAPRSPGFGRGGDGGHARRRSRRRPT